MNSTLPAWVERPQATTRQHSSDKVFASLVGGAPLTSSSSAAGHPRPRSAEASKSLQALLASFASATEGLTRQGSLPSHFFFRQSSISAGGGPATVAAHPNKAPPACSPSCSSSSLPPACNLPGKSHHHQRPPAPPGRAASLNLPPLSSRGATAAAAPPAAAASPLGNNKLSVLIAEPAPAPAHPHGGSGGYVADAATPFGLSVMPSRPNSAEIGSNRQHQATPAALEGPHKAVAFPSAGPDAAKQDPGCCPPYDATSAASPAPAPPGPALQRSRSLLQQTSGPDGCPPYGCKGSCGQRSSMQDANAAVQNFAWLNPSQSMVTLHKWPETLEPPVPGASNGQCEASMDVDGSSPRQQQQQQQHPEAYHLFAVFDGHGGSSASHTCANVLSQRLLESLGGARDYNYSRKAPAAEPRKDEEGESVELLGQNADSRGGNVVEAEVDAEGFQGAVLEAFRRVDRDVAASQAGQGSEEYAGSTAVVSMLSKSQIWVANCGDSRAVLLRGGKALQLSSDQTAAREDEVKRIEGAGGEIYYLQDCARVQGVLAMSRSIGDNYLHPFVIPDPEHTALPRAPDDEILILASDGLWDKVGNQEACDVAKRCLARARAKGASRRAAAKCAASVLLKSAQSKGSRDNVTVVVADLRSQELYDASAPQ